MQPTLTALLLCRYLQKARNIPPRPPNPGAYYLYAKPALASETRSGAKLLKHSVIHCVSEAKYRRVSEFCFTNNMLRDLGGGAECFVLFVKLWLKDGYVLQIYKVYP